METLREANMANDGADDGIRTRDLRFTKPLLYQLSYVGAERAKITSGDWRSKRKIDICSCRSVSLRAFAEHPQRARSGRFLS
jgi:hypothetical protein